MNKAKARLIGLGLSLGALVFVGFNIVEYGQDDGTLTFLYIATERCRYHQGSGFEWGLVILRNLFNNDFKKFVSQ
jgi:hypothetical protein